MSPRASAPAGVLRARLRAAAEPGYDRTLSWFFKTGPGQYGAGDRFLGVRMPRIRAIAATAGAVRLDTCAALLRSAWHEDRLLALVLMTRAMSGADGERRSRVYDLYCRHIDRVNNWDLVDVSAPAIIGAHTAARRDGLSVLRRMARSPDLWQRRIAMVATYHDIRLESFSRALDIAGRLIDDDHDLIHKAVGWMLREIGKRDDAPLRAFLDRHAATMPRTMLRYALERMPRRDRQRYMAMGSARRPAAGPPRRRRT